MLTHKVEDSQEPQSAQVLVWRIRTHSGDLCLECRREESPGEWYYVFSVGKDGTAYRTRYLPTRLGLSLDDTRIMLRESS